MKDLYSDTVVKHFRHPHNIGEIRDADGEGTAGNPVCGDIMRLYIKVKNNKITNIKFKTMGCAAAIATSSMITDLAKGKTLAEALGINRESVASALGGLPPIKMHCSNLAADALHMAVYDYLKKSGSDPKLLKEAERLVKALKKQHFH
ncbi:iron-sulfur cluster assembly scaffold protein [Candidatus Micrarchaeota archaeon]|nr:iron-sulfur cluster assembly scaffold protein [Candidatus Micrarchaeota archaeon]